MGMHPIHVSVVNMEVIPDEDIYVSVKVFLDDFTTVVEGSENQYIDFNDSTEVVSYEDVILNYFSKHFIIKCGKKKYNDFTFVDWKRNEEAGWFNFTVNKTIGKVPDHCENTILFDLFHDQTNLLIVYYNKKEFGYRFNHKNSEQDLKLKNK